MTPAELAFLSEIITDRGEDTVRLAYADWLDENSEPSECLRCLDGKMYGRHPDKLPGAGWGWYPCQACRGTGRIGDGRERAEFIRVQIALLRMDDPTTETVEEYSRLLLLNNRLQPFFEQKWHTEFGGIGVFAGRGFVESVICTAEAWSNISDALVWHPGATMACPNCEGFGEFTRTNHDGPPGPCPDCGGQWEPRDDEYDKGWSAGTGRVPRPCPPTAQPVEKITITSGADDDFCTTHNFSVTHRTGGEQVVGFRHSIWTSPKWPGVEFVLDNVRYYRLVEEAVRQIRGRT